MQKETIRVTVVLEYEVDPDLYPDQKTPAERAEADHRNFTDDHETLVALIHDAKVVSIRTSSCTTTG